MGKYKDKFQHSSLQISWALQLKKSTALHNSQNVVFCYGCWGLQILTEHQLAPFYAPAPDKIKSFFSGLSQRVCTCFATWSTKYELEEHHNTLLQNYIPCQKKIKEKTVSNMLQIQIWGWGQSSTFSQENVYLGYSGSLRASSEKQR